MNVPQNVQSLHDKKLAFSYYVGVMRSSNMYRQLSQLVLAYFIGNSDSSVAQANCTGQLYNWMLLGTL